MVHGIYYFPYVIRFFGYGEGNLIMSELAWDNLVSCAAFGNNTKHSLQYVASRFLKQHKEFFIKLVYWLPSDMALLQWQYNWRLKLKYKG